MSLRDSTITLEGGLRLSVAATGDDSGPPLVVLPGPTDSWRSYATVLERLPSSVRAIAVSQRGHGDSDKPPTGFRIADFAADAVRLLDALDIERATLVGHSGSCLVARRVAVDHPERISGLVLEASPTTLRGHPGLEDFVATVVSELRDPIDPEFARGVIRDTSSDDLEPELLDELASDLLKVPARVWHEMFTDLLTYDDLAELAAISAPTLLLWGDADGIVDRAMQDELVERIEGAQLRVYDGVGHTPRWEDPAGFARDVAELVQRSAHA